MMDTIEVGVKVNGPWWVSAVYWSQVAWRVALAGFLCVLAWQAYSLRKLPDWTERQIARESNNTRAAALDAITGTRKELLAEVANLRKDVMTRVDNATDKADGQLTAMSGMVDTRLKDLTDKTDAQLTRTNDSLAAVTGGLKPVLEHSSAITAHADEAAAILLRRDALPAQTLGLIAATKVAMGEAAQTMRTVRDAAPGLTKQAERVGNAAAGIAEDGHKEADAFLKPKTFRQKLAMWLEMIPRVVKVIL